jgi:hypothetical protein
MIPLPNPRDWVGAQRRYLTHDEKQDIVAGRPFEILDAQLDHGQELDCAYLVKFLDSPNSAIWTRHASASRIRLAHAVLEAVGRGETIGPVCCIALPSAQPDRASFPLVVNYHAPAEALGGGGPDFGTEAAS